MDVLTPGKRTKVVHFLVGQAENLIWIHLTQVGYFACLRRVGSPASSQGICMSPLTKLESDRLLHHTGIHQTLDTPDLILSLLKLTCHSLVSTEAA